MGTTPGRDLCGFFGAHACSQNWGFSLKAAYEAQYWWEQLNTTGNLLGIVIGGGNLPKVDLLMQGLTLEGSIYF